MGISGYMRPAEAVQDAADGCLANAKFSPQSAIGHPDTGTYFPDLMLGEFGASRTFSARIASLLDRICYIVRLGSEEQVIGVDTSGRIAAVKNIRSRRNWTRERPVRRAGSMSPSSRFDTSKTTISVVVETPGPQPASRIWVFFYTLQKQFSHRKVAEHALKWFVHGVSMPRAPIVNRAKAFGLMRLGTTAKCAGLHGLGGYTNARD